MDLTLPINYNVFVEREGFTFFSDIEYKNIPVLCSHCKKTGHEVQDCKFRRKITANTNPKGKTTYVPKVSNVIPPSLVIIEDAEVIIESDKRDLNTSKGVDIEADIEQILLSEDSDTQLSNFVEATPDRAAIILDTNAADASFLKNSWGNLEEIDKGNSRGEWAFINAVSQLKKKQSTKKKETLHY
ncbi:uncharacterized protein LOC131660437 [Vicia villosa]|uniref:uncharacterized protein LOC131660437 n=1 Tax=Vicia villosa TaxID=3911 RepID=UPI00273AAE59|nr:uncharacterized protein LOC131660437 [Vicia villosa]